MKLLNRVSHRCLEHGGGGSSKFDWGEGVGGGGLSKYMGGAWGRLKVLSKNTCDGVHLIVKLPTVSLQACKFTKNELDCMFLSCHVRVSE